MFLSNVNVGSFANSGTGDPLRTAFEVINQNFANIAINSTNVAGVSSVAGRSGHVLLGSSDVAGVASLADINAAVTTLNSRITSTTQFTMQDPTAWIRPVYTVDEALNQIAFRLKNAGY
ncbi:MAG TPA: hypothetical protein VFM18_17430 [Methanosarcina sp.]|nr:hypothetical protein [Methanosarcina sp.]